MNFHTTKELQEAYNLEQVCLRARDKVRGWPWDAVAIETLRKADNALGQYQITIGWSACSVPELRAYTLQHNENA